MLKKPPNKHLDCFANPGLLAPDGDGQPVQLRLSRSAAERPLPIFSFLKSKSDTEPVPL
jgi:hypothetical protein